METEIEILRKTIQRTILFILGLLLSLLVIRFLMLFFEVQQTFPLAGVVLGLTNWLVAPFQDFLINSVDIGLFIDVPTVMAMVAVIVMGLIIQDFILTFIDDDPARIIVNLIDAFLKVIEFLLITRFILLLFAVGAANNTFANTIYELTNWSNLGAGVLFVMNGYVEIGLLVCFVVIVAFDFFWEGLAEGVLRRPIVAKKIVKTTVTQTTSTPVAAAQPKQVVMLSKEQFEELKQKN